LTRSITRGLNAGILLDFRNPSHWRRPWADLYADTITLAAEVDRLGLATIWLTEHHFTDDGYCPSCLVAAAAIAATTRRARIGTFTLLLPLHDAVRIAEDAATVDCLSGGRLDLGLALGYRAEEFAALGHSRGTRRARMEEGLQVLQGLLAGGAVNFSGVHYRLDGVRLGLQPVQQPIPMWLGARSDVAAERAAHHGAHLSLAGERSVYAAYAAALRGRGIDPAIRRVCRRVRVLPTLGNPDQAWRRIEPHARYEADLYAGWLRQAADVRADRDDNAARRWWIVGPPDHVVESLLRWRGDLPITDAVCLSVPPGISPLEVAEWAGLYMSDVQPLLDRALGTKVAVGPKEKA
jgi:alkanesulfonate monooxygenase SsuD/methylene tetrahydromethanopterin reductase-like flavin-dependent oxidoreductase (luciferase family)